MHQCRWLVLIQDRLQGSVVSMSMPIVVLQRLTRLSLGSPLYCGELGVRLLQAAAQRTKPAPDESDDEGGGAGGTAREQGGGGQSVLVKVRASDGSQERFKVRCVSGHTLASATTPARFARSNSIGWFTGSDEGQAHYNWRCRSPQQQSNVSRLPLLSTASSTWSPTPARGPPTTRVGRRIPRSPAHELPPSVQGDPLEKLFRAYVKKAHPGGTPAGAAFSFVFDGDPIDAKSSPEELGLEDDDMIEVVRST